MHIYGFQKTTLLDYPGHLAASIFLGGCDFRCPFCHNTSLILPSSYPAEIEADVVFNTLYQRKHLLEGVCITGGEPTLHSELPEFLKQLKSLGLKIKLDTNGCHPEVLIDLAEQHLLDYIAMDIKNSKEHYAQTAGITEFDIEPIEKSAAFLLRGQIPYEFRTTVVRELHEKSDFISIAFWIAGADAYYLQSYQESGDILFDGLSAYSRPEMEEFLNILLPTVPHAKLRGI